ncbi:MAG: xylulose kinase, partial [Deltaproteobacteria bacterium]|nr:xylulose kinase [Deltaproteobacteria bacterium]
MEHRVHKKVKNMGQAAMAGLSLGLDLSTQSITAVVLDIETREIIFSHSLDYRADPRLTGSGIGDDYIISPGTPGEADQPPELFYRALDAMFADLVEAGVDLGRVAVINSSGQQHGHVYLNGAAKAIFSALQNNRFQCGENLVSLLGGALAYGTAPIWRTSNTASQADFLREHTGGKERMIQLSGSNSPLRFTGAVVRRVGEQFPEAYQATRRIQLISSLCSAILTGNSDVPIDFGNACGMSMMNYHRKTWSRELIKAVAYGLPGGAKGLRRKLPGLVSPDAIVGSIAGYFSKKYGLNKGCLVAAGSGDNPQTKVLVSGDLLSLGTSFVNMVSTDSRALDMNGYANAMYDGIGRAFIFGCRTNGAMVWDMVRAGYGLKKEEYKPTEKLLAAGKPGRNLFFWRPEHESFPVSGTLGQTRIDYSEPSLKADYSGIVDSSLAAVYLNSRDFSRNSDKSLYLTGGAAMSPEVVRRVAAVWNRNTIVIEAGQSTRDARETWLKRKRSGF